MSAGGFTADPIYILADNNMQKQDFDVYAVPGLHGNTGMVGTGYVVFCKTRCCNQAFYE